jgi:hypothetical protein
MKNTWKVSNMVLEKDGEDRMDRSVKNEEVLHTRRKGIPHTKYKEESLSGLAISCVETTL